jgi:hypothetical protein
VAVRIPICGGEGEAMNRRKLSHVVAGGILAVLLALPGPALASSLQARTVESMWQRLAGLWQQHFSVLPREQTVLRKEGYGIDPNGGRSAGAGGSSSPSTPTSGTGSIDHGAGFGVNPNG